MHLVSGFGYQSSDASYYMTPSTSYIQRRVTAFFADILQCYAVDMSNQTLCIPYVAGIIERRHEGKLQLLIQTRWKPERDPVYSGTYEFVAGVMDVPFENVYETLKRELSEEVGLSLKNIVGDSQTKPYTPKDDASFAFRPFCCTQQLKNGRPWVGFVFRCEVEDTEPVAQATEVRTPIWMDATEVKALFESSPASFFTLELPAWEYYFKEVTA
jgi:8-oxo-dGTP pyrophosphatase MutT (NUDIX family)